MILILIIFYWIKNDIGLQLLPTKLHNFDKVDGYIINYDSTGNP